MHNQGNSSQDTQYDLLVQQRKKCRLCEPDLKNPMTVNPLYDCNEIGAWSQWYGNLNAEIVLIGQDWGSIKYYNENHGKDNPNDRTMLNLIKLFSSIGIKIDKPYSHQNRHLFFTNTVLCLKEGNNMSGPKNQNFAVIAAIGS